MPEALLSESSVQELFFRGPHALPKEALHSDTKSRAWTKWTKRLDATRYAFFESLKSGFDPNPSVYYPGCGADPIPAAVFGENIIYISAKEEGVDFFDWLRRNPREAPTRYRNSLGRYGPFPTLKVLYADILRSPFLDQSFDIVVINNLPSILVRNSITEVNRLLKPNGVFVFEAETRIDREANLEPDYTKVLAKSKDEGFVPHELDKFGGAMNVTYLSKADLVGDMFDFNQEFTWDSKAYLHEIESGLPSELTDLLSQDFSVLIRRREFVQRLKRGLPVTMCAHEIRVFQKPA